MFRFEEDAKKAREEAKIAEAMSWLDGEEHAAAKEWIAGIRENKEIDYHNPHARIADLMAMEGYYKAKMAEIAARRRLILKEGEIVMDDD